MKNFINKIRMNRSSLLHQYKIDKSYEERHAEATKITNKFKDRLPIIVERVKNSKIPDLDKNKYLVPMDLTVGQFMLIIRNRIKLDESVAMFMYINNFIPQTSALMSEIYTKHKDPDGFLYIFYTGESVFGGYLYLFYLFHDLEMKYLLILEFVGALPLILKFPINGSGSLNILSNNCVTRTGLS